MEKVIFFRLACAKGHIVATAPKTPFFDPLGDPVARISLDPLGSFNPLGGPVPGPVNPGDPIILGDRSAPGFADNLDPLGGDILGGAVTRRRWAIGARRGVIDQRRGGAGFEGAGEGRSKVGRWQGGIAEPVKFF